jgi:2-C-methyl-D-erythritol 4-phosphate cytidylyltransferase
VSTAGILAAVDFHLDPSRAQDSPGVFDRLGDRSLLSWTFRVLWDAGCRPVVVVAPPKLAADITAELGAGAAVVQHTGHRGATVLGALSMIATERVAVLDFRHPLATSEDVNAVAAELDQADACVGVVPVKETLKLVKHGAVIETLDRTEMWQQVMPHAFRVSALRKVHGPGGETEEEITDDVRAIQQSGGRVVIVPVSTRNLRVTTRDDMEIAQALMAKKR